MFPAALLAASLVTLAPQPQPPASRPTLRSQSMIYATAAAAVQDSAPRTAKRDNKWDGALAGVLAGGAAGAVNGLVLYGQGGGEWPGQGEFMAATTLFGAAAGGVIGLAIDLIKR